MLAGQLESFACSHEAYEVRERLTARNEHLLEDQHQNLFESEDMNDQLLSYHIFFDNPDLPSSP